MQKDGYPELANIAFSILIMSPDTVTCERGFSVLKHIKNKKRTLLTQEHLGCSLRMGLDGRSPPELFI